MFLHMIMFLMQKIINNNTCLRILVASQRIKWKQQNKQILKIELTIFIKNFILLKKYNDVWNGIRDKIKKISNDECDY